MTAEPLSFTDAAARRLLQDWAGEPVSLGSLAAELDLAPPEAFALLLRLTACEPTTWRAEFVIACECCGTVIDTVTGPAAWALAGGRFSLVCNCGHTVQREDEYLDLVLQPVVAARPQPAKRVAESSRSRSKTLGSPTDSPQLSLDFD